MDIKKLDIEYGDIVILTYDDSLDIDTLNQHFEMVKNLLHEHFGCIVIANKKDFIQDIVIVKGDGGLPFR